MAKLKEKASNRSSPKKSGGKLAKKAKSRDSTMKAQTQEEIERENRVGSTPVMTDPQPFNTPPPIPPSLLYLRKMATIPGLRRGTQEG